MVLRSRTTISYRGIVATSIQRNEALKRQLQFMQLCSFRPSLLGNDRDQIRGE